MTTDTKRPWTAPGLTVMERAQEVYDQNRRFNASLRQKLVIKEAIEAACSQALADAAPKWVCDKKDCSHGIDQG